MSIWDNVFVEREVWEERLPEANKHEIDMLYGEYGTYAKFSLLSWIESGTYKLGTMT